ncbi:MAG TPA: hypothetical protein PKC87_06400, partial [Candidatus Absconditabacterales bacterium]|nr:hypothetical protein [Candidatus Absconditabacterales bacterium]
VGGNNSIASGVIILDTIFPIITVYNPNTTPSYSKTISGSTNEGILYQTITTGTLCDGSLTFSPYHITTFSGETDNGKKICYKALDLAGNTSYSVSDIIQGIDRTHPVVSAIYPNSGLILSGTNSITFLRSGSDTMISGYTLYVNGSGYSTTGTSYTINNMINGAYTWYVLATDYAGNTGRNEELAFTLIPPLSGTVTSNNSYSGYTTISFPINLWTNISAQFSITGDITGTTSLPYTGIVNPSITHFLGLVPGDGTKTIYITFLTGNQTYSINKSIVLDTTAPTIPILSSPISGEIISGTCTLNRSTVVDSGVGLSGYQYFIATTGTLGTGIISSGFTTNTYVSITNTISGTNKNYFWYIQAIDRLGNSSVSSIQSFTYNQGYDII